GKIKTIILLHWGVKKVMEYEKQARIIMIRLSKYIPINVEDEENYMRGLINGLKAVDRQKEMRE
ncbi:MAG: hypothetical protein L0L78_11950, partial [Tetragenococcus koreensis]|nr:hypothetical protein [Tetragenococcus sp.]MDN6736321.1 hypothetical protein [Tetragenococcus koreensis]